MKPFINMPMSEYLGRPEVSASQLSCVLDNALEYKLMRDGKITRRSKETDMGSVFHTCVLEPEKSHEVFTVSDDIKQSIIDLAGLPLDELIVIEVDNKLKKEFQDAKKNNPTRTVVTSNEFDAILKYLKLKDKIILNREEYDTVNTMVSKIFALNGFKNYVDVGLKEKTFFGEIEGVPIRIRPDLMVHLKDNQYMVFDIKSMGEPATGANFAKASARYNYFMSEAIYRNILSQNGIEVMDYSYVGVSKIEWSGADYFRHNEFFLMEGEKFMNKAIQKYKYCVANNIWPERQFDFDSNSFPVISEVILPTWVFYKYQ